MAVNLENFNRIIDLEFTTGGAKYDDKGFALNKTKSIICPRHGIKPNIEINATYGAAFQLHAFHITIKNLYVDLRTEQYSHIRVRAGYANNNTVFEADILNMYQDNPGPESTTTIECLTGNLTQTWLDSTVSLDFKSGTTLNEIMQKLKSKLNASSVTLGKAAIKLSLEQPMQFNGTVRSALISLQDRFKDDYLQVFMQGSKLCAVCNTKGDYINQRVLQYMSAPIQKNPGDEQGNWTAMITAPWMPDLLPGDELVIPNQVYIRDGNLVGGAQPTQKMEITEMSFHFSTVGRVNQMTCEGFIAR